MNQYLTVDLENDYEIKTYYGVAFTWNYDGSNFYYIQAAPHFSNDTSDMIVDKNGNVFYETKNGDRLYGRISITPDEKYFMSEISTQDEQSTLLIFKKQDEKTMYIVAKISDYTGIPEFIDNNTVSLCKDGKVQIFKISDLINNNDVPTEYAYSPYAYECGMMNDEQLTLYHELYSKVMVMEPFSYKLEDYGYDTLDNLLVAWAVLSTDYPQIDNYFFLEEKTDEEGNIISFDSYYGCIWEEDLNKDSNNIKMGLEKFDLICEDIIKNMPKDVTAYEKYYYLAGELSERVEYDYSLSLPAVGTPYCIVTGDGICQGYAQAYQYLCMKANLWCRIMSGSSRGWAHAWNIVKLENGIFHIDVTWSDEYGIPGSEGWMKYFMLTEEQIIEDHEISQ